MTVAEHTYDETLLPEREAMILDAGCGDFEFMEHFVKQGHNVLAVDIRDFGKYAWRLAITGKNGRVGIKHDSDGQATKVVDGDEIRSYTIQEFARINDIEMFDLIKLDIEGSEIDAILAMTRPMGRQITVEFHMHCGQKREDVDKAVDYLHSLGYITVQHELTDQHCAGFNYWNSLFKLS